MCNGNGDGILDSGLGLWTEEDEELGNEAPKEEEVVPDDKGNIPREEDTP